MFLHENNSEYNYGNRGIKNQLEHPKDRRGHKSLYIDKNGDIISEDEDFDNDREGASIADDNNRSFRTDSTRQGQHNRKNLVQGHPQKRSRRQCYKGDAQNQADEDETAMVLSTQLADDGGEA